MPVAVPPHTPLYLHLTPPSTSRQVLFSDASHSKVQLCDFGFALRCGERRLRTVCGSAQYMAPELHASAGDGYLGPPVDMWALGAMLYEMLHGKPAF